MIHQYSSSIKSIKRDCGVRTRLISESHRLQSSSQKHGSPASSSTSHDRVVFGSSSSSTGTAWYRCGTWNVHGMFNLLRKLFHDGVAKNDVHRTFLVLEILSLDWLFHITAKDPKVQV